MSLAEQRTGGESRGRGQDASGGQKAAKPPLSPSFERTPPPWTFPAGPLFRDSLALNRSRGEALDHPALDEHVQADDRERRDHRRGHELSPRKDVAVDQKV